MTIPSSSIDELIKDTGGAFLYDPHNNGEIILLEKDGSDYWIAHYVIMGRDNDRIKVQFLSYLPIIEDIDSLIDDYPEWAAQQLYGRDLLEIIK